MSSKHEPNRNALLAIREIVNRTGRTPSRIAAIKVYRMITGCGLKEAKDDIESWIDFDPDSPSANPDTSGPTVRVRIAVAVDSDGRYEARGSSAETREGSMEIAADALDSQHRCYMPEAHVYVTADLPIPQAVEVEAEVEDNSP